MLNIKLIVSAAKLCGLRIRAKKKESQVVPTFEKTFCRKTEIPVNQ